MYNLIVELFNRVPKNEIQKLDKLKILNEKRREVDHIVDKLGKGIDEEIKDTIAVLKAMDFVTDSSCAGHTDEDGYGPPYIQFYTKAPEGWKENEKIRDEWKELNLKQRERLEPLLEEFYIKRAALKDVKLQLHNIGLIGGFRVESQGLKMNQEELNIKTKQDVLNKIRLYQIEIREFAKFLTQKFLSNM